MNGAASVAGGAEAVHVHRVRRVSERLPAVPLLLRARDQEQNVRPDRQPVRGVVVGGGGEEEKQSRRQLESGTGETGDRVMTATTGSIPHITNFAL